MGHREAHNRRSVASKKFPSFLDLEGSARPVRPVLGSMNVGDEPEQFRRPIV